MLPAAFGALGLFLIFVFFVWRLERAMRRAAERDQLQQVLDDIHKANDARDRLRRDPDAAKLLRGRFTRGLL